jgi:hypothetical protein
MGKTEEKITGMTTIQMTNKQFLTEFSPAFNKVANLPANPKSGKLKYALKRTLGSVQAVGEAFEKKAREIREPLAKMDDDGNPKTTENGMDYVYDGSENKKKAEEGMKKLYDTVIYLTVYPVRLSTITDALTENYNLTFALELNLGEFIIENAELNRQIEEDEKAEKKTSNKS